MKIFPKLTIALSGLLALGLAAGLQPPRAAAQETLRVAAVVNDEIISGYDLEQRIRLTLLSSNLPDNVETRTRVVPSVLRRLIDEHLQGQEAKRLKLNVETSEIENGIAAIERQNNMPRGSFVPFLKSHNIDPSTVRQQVRSEIAWNRVIRKELVPDLRIGDAEVEARLAAQKANFGKPEYLAAEITLLVDDPRREDEVRQLGERLIDQMRQGTPFSALARQFSQSSGASGGDLGWVSEGMLDPELMTALASIQKGTVTPPIRTIDGYHILLLRDKRIAGETSVSSGPVVDLLTIVLNSVPSATAAERADQLKRLRDALAPGKTCDDFVRLSEKIPSAQAFRNGRMAVSEVPPDLEPLIADLKPGEISQPKELDNKRQLFAVCSRTEPTRETDSLEAMRRRMENEQLDNMARGYLRNLRRAAFIEIRI